MVLKKALRSGDPRAARQLLAHSVALGHERLAVRRYFAARCLGVDDLEEFRPFCTEAARHFAPGALLSAARAVAGRLQVACDIHCIVSELLTAGIPLQLPYGETWPLLKSSPAYCGTRVSLLGRIEIGHGPWFGPGSVVRADGHFVHIGNDFRIGERSTVHISHNLLPTVIGSRVSVGRDAVVHACIVGDNCVIEDGVIILDGSCVENGVLVEAGSTVYPRSNLKAGLIYSGSPAKPIRELEDQELKLRRMFVSDAIFLSIFNNAAADCFEPVSLGGHVFVATTALLKGNVEAGKNVGIFFGCDINAADFKVEIAENTNIQDNTIIEAAAGKIEIGANTTIGHNVLLRSCRIGDSSLVGIGSKLANGTIIEDDVLLAAGSTTMPGQQLERGWLWGGQPARPISMLDSAKRSMMSATIEQYCEYGAQFKTLQRARMS
ncbi:MAG: gamma carbonic anhydrase family protein [Aestuariivirga sp.]|nr:gamma carbonic anhydrase family protein [Aestuariivirga sp.]